MRKTTTSAAFDRWDQPIGSQRGRRRKIAFATSMSVALNLILLFAFTWRPEIPPMAPVQEPVTLAIVSAPAPEPSPAPPAPVPPAPPKAAPKPAVKPAPERPPTPAKARPTPVVRPQPSPIAAAAAPPAFPQLSDAQMAAASTAASGSGAGSGAGGQCNMIAFLQNELRKDGSVRRALAQAQQGSRAPIVWNGAWVRSPGEEGEGLAVIRQAVMVEVAFAPEACRADPVSGYVVIALDDGPLSPKLAIGAGSWRWTDLLGSRERLVGTRN